MYSDMNTFNFKNAILTHVIVAMADLYLGLERFVFENRHLHLQHRLCICNDKKGKGGILTESVSC